MNLGQSAFRTMQRVYRLHDLLCTISPLPTTLVELVQAQARELWSFATHGDFQGYSFNHDLTHLAIEFINDCWEGHSHETWLIDLRTGHQHSFGKGSFLRCWFQNTLMVLRYCSCGSGSLVCGLYDLRGNHLGSLQCCHCSFRGRDWEPRRCLSCCMLDANWNFDGTIEVEIEFDHDEYERGVTRWQKVVTPLAGIQFRKIDSSQLIDPLVRWERGITTGTTEINDLQITVEEKEVRVRKKESSVDISLYQTAWRIIYVDLYGDLLFVVERSRLGEIVRILDLSDLIGLYPCDYEPVSSYAEVDLHETFLTEDSCC